MNILLPPCEAGVVSQRSCVGSESVLTPNTSHSRRRNSSIRLLTAVNSVGQTREKSLG